MGKSVIELLTSAQMRAIEGAAIASGAVTGVALMERAGRGVVNAVFEEWPQMAKAPHRAIVLCGPGNNGGDGFVVARLLLEWGWEVEVFLYGDPAHLPPDAKANYQRWRALGAVRAVDDIADGGDLLGLDADLFIDALFGTGLTRPLDLPAPHLGAFFDFGQQWLCENGPPTVAVDLASGICADSGKKLGGAMAAALTVTFHAPKRGHYLGDGPLCCGKLRVVDIGLPKNHRLRMPNDIAASLPEEERGTAWVIEGPRQPLQKQPNAHKYTHGHALILSGVMGGAARLAARGALRVGAGAVTLGCPAATLPENAAQLNAIMLTGVQDGAALIHLLRDARINALCLGPGLGLSEDQAGLVAAALASGRNTVLDADALTLLSQDKALFGALHEKCVLTPHAGEFARLFPDLAERLNATPTAGPASSKLDAARGAAARAGCTVLFKGPDTVIANPKGHLAINAAVYDRAAPWLATAGAGDVLAGFITGLLARGFGMTQAAEAGAWLHVEAARAFGPGLIAEDLPEQVPRVFRDLGL